MKQGLISAVIVVLGAVSNANAGATGHAVIDLVPDFPGPVPDGSPLHFEITATMTEAPVNADVALRGMQLDYSATAVVIDLPASMDYVNPAGLYAEFEDLPVPASAWVLPNPILPFMVVLELGEPVLLGSVDVIAQKFSSIETLDVANAGEPDINFGGSLKFGFGVDDDDPITDWRFNTGELSGGTYDIDTLTPEPATMALVVIGALAGFRRRRFVGRRS